mmetsp:Transcript_18647/g.18886  ORF Transcript_18647/g.18886 Transcript_18647/m.18886 type:complete len:106 (-) Transcript_18647:218-535(-)
MLRYQLFLAYGVAILSTWIALMKNEDMIIEHSATIMGPFVVNSNHVKVVIQFLPFWAIVLLGAYAATSVVIGVLTFKDCPEAALEIEQQVRDAKIELKKKGFNAD